MSYGFQLATGPSGANVINSDSYVPGLYIDTWTITGSQNATNTINYSGVYGTLFILPFYGSTNAQAQWTPDISFTQNKSAGTATVTAVWANNSGVNGQVAKVLVFMA